jgi:hypothetical protein
MPSVIPGLSYSVLSSGEWLADANPYCASLECPILEQLVRFEPIISG